MPERTGERGKKGSAAKSIVSDNTPLLLIAFRARTDQQLGQVTIGPLKTTGDLFKPLMQSSLRHDIKHLQ